MNWATRLGERGCRFIYVRHEHCAVAAAMAYARKSGEVGVATVTCGPGVTQLMTALPAAVRAHTPLVVFAGEAPLKSAWYNQGIDQSPMVTATGAAYHSLHLPARMPQAIRDAFVQAKTERRPVVLGIPFDLQNTPWAGETSLPAPSHEIMSTAQPPAPRKMHSTRRQKPSRRPRRVVFAARCSGVWRRLRLPCVSTKAGGLLTTTLPARGLFHDDLTHWHHRSTDEVGPRLQGSGFGDRCEHHSPSMRAVVDSYGQMRRCFTSILRPPRSVRANTLPVTIFTAMRN